MPAEVGDNTVLLTVLAAVGAGLAGIAGAIWRVCVWIAPKIEKTFVKHDGLIDTLNATSVATHAAAIQSAETSLRIAQAVEANSKQLATLQKINEDGLKEIADRMPEFCRVPPHQPKPA